VRVLFGSERYTAELAWTDLAAGVAGARRRARPALGGPPEIEQVTGPDKLPGLLAALESGRLGAANLQRWAQGEAPRWAVNSPAFRRRPPGRG